MTEQKKDVGNFLFSIGGAVLVLVIIVLINLIFVKVNLRWDATEDNLYSLSDSSKEIIDDLAEPVTIKLFFSSDALNMPVQIKTYARRVSDFLSEYATYSGGGIGVETYNPEPDSEEEEWAQKYGVEGIDLPSGETVYFGLVAMAGTQEEAIAFLDPNREAHLEYDITRMITRLQMGPKPKVAVFSGYPVFGGNPQMGMPQPGGGNPWQFVSELQKSYEVIRVQPGDTAIDPEAGLLILINPMGMDPGLEYAVDQFVINGGRAIFFVDPLPVLGQPPGPGQQVYPQRLFKQWGVSLEAGKVVADFDYPTALRGQNNEVENNPFWLSLNGSIFYEESVITAQLESMLLPVAGSLQVTETEGLTVQTLLRSSTNAAMVESFQAQFGAGDLRKEFKPEGSAFTLSILLRGIFASAFPEGKPGVPGQELPEENGAKQNGNETSPQHLNQSKTENVVLVVSDADLLFDAYYMSRQSFLGINMSQIFNDNLNFFLNACEMLTGNEKLIDIRSRGSFERPFTRVQELKRQADAKWMAEEQRLLRMVEETNKKLEALQLQKDKSQKLILSSEQEAEIRKFKQQRLEINQELKIVRRNLQAEIKTLGNWLKFINILLMPMIIFLAGLIYALARRRKQTRAM